MGFSAADVSLNVGDPTSGRSDRGDRHRVDADKAGIFLSGLVIARIPLFLFQAIQAIVLPGCRCSRRGDLGGFRSDLRRLYAAMERPSSPLGAAAPGRWRCESSSARSSPCSAARHGAADPVLVVDDGRPHVNQAVIALPPASDRLAVGVATAAFLAIVTTNGRRGVPAGRVGI